MKVAGYCSNTATFVPTRDGSIKMTDRFINVFIWMDDHHEYTGDTPIGAFSWSTFANEVPTPVYITMRIKLSKWLDADLYHRVELMQTLIEELPRSCWFRPEELVNN